MTPQRPQPRIITTIRQIDSRWVVIRNGRQVYTHPVRTACEQWRVKHPQA